MRRPTTRLPSLLLAASLLVGGCGAPQQVTYVDPNDEAAIPRDGTSQTPVEAHGVDAISRANAVVRMRAALAVARTVAPTDPAAAKQVLDATITDDLPAVLPRVQAADPKAAAALRTGLERLRDRPPVNPAGYNAEVRRLADVVLAKAESLAVPAEARQDAGFRAAVLAETIVEAATSYEASFDGGTQEIVAPEEYRRAYGLLIDVATRQLEAVPEDVRPALRAKLDKLTRRTLPGPTPPLDPRDPTTVVGELSDLSDQVTEAASIDPTYPPPDDAAPDRLRALKRRIASSVETYERGARDAAVQQLANDYRTQLWPVASSIAAVDPALLAQLETDIAVTLPETMRSGGDASAAAVDLDVRLDDAISLVEEELGLLRDS